MLTSPAFIFLVGRSMAAMCRKVKLPRMIGMLITDSVLGRPALCLSGTDWSWSERLFCIIASLPKATVQAALGSVPPAMGLPCGAMVLSVAVLVILITAPLGASAMDMTYKILLKKEHAGETMP